MGVAGQFVIEPVTNATPHDTRRCPCKTNGRWQHVGANGNLPYPPNYTGMAMIRSHPYARFSAAVITGIAATILIAGVALAHPESEGEHAGSCIVTVEPGSVTAG